MKPRDKEAEVHAIQEAHRAAQARLGIAGSYLAMSEWGSVSALQASATGSSWVSRSLRMITALRRKSRRLAIAYVQLVRALETGYTLGLPEYSDNPKAVTMGGLRQQFTELLLEVADIDRQDSGQQDPDEKWFESEVRRASEGAKPSPDRINLADTDLKSYIENYLNESGSDDAFTVTVEDFTFPDDMKSSDIDQAFQKALTDDVVKAHDEKVKMIRRRMTDSPATQALDSIQKAHAGSGAIGGGRVDRYGVEAGREVIDEVIAKDKRVTAYARGTRPGCCAFCAMLASRGFVYASKRGALTTTNAKSRSGKTQATDGTVYAGKIRLYHDNCHCFVIVRFIDVPSLSPQSSYFQANWKKVTEGQSYRNGKNNALNTWRTWLNHERLAEAGKPIRGRGRPPKTK